MKPCLKTLLALLCVVLAATTLLVSCAPSSVVEETTTASSETNEETELETITYDETEIRVSVLNGTTGFGAAQMIHKATSGFSVLNYNFTVESDAANVTAGLINGSVDIAALPTNAAATVYNKTGGKVQIAAINTLGVLYLLTNDKVEVNSFADLKGKTVYCPAQNPAFIFEAICRANNLEPGKDVTIDTAFAQPADLRTAVASGQVDIAVLPEPMVTIAKNANASLKTALDLTAEWEKVYGEDSLAQGCIVVRTEWAEAHPIELALFLGEYRESIEFTNNYPAEASEMIVEAGIFAQAPIAQKAIPNCNIVYITGEEMATALDVFFTKLHAVNPAAVGGAIPDSGIYYGK
jgi:NitT/TauT family transport system substrate-binding protein